MKPRDMTNELYLILKKCAKITQKNPPTLQALDFPTSEYWRFFIEVNKQNAGAIYLNYLYTLYDEVLKKLEKRRDKIKNPKKEKKSSSPENEVLKIFLEQSDKDKKNILSFILQQSLPNLEKMAHTQLMISEFNFFFQECNRVVADIKETFACKNPKRFSTMTLEQLLKYCRGWLPQEIIEPGSVAAFVKQMPKIGIAETKKTLSNADAFAKNQIALIKQFHGDVIENVSEITRNETYPSKKGDYAFRDSKGVGFQMTLGVNVTIKGLHESQTRYHILKKSFPMYHQHVVLKNGTGMYTSTLLCKSGQTESLLELMMLFLLKDYFTKAEQVNDPLKKLSLIISLIRDIEQLHPFDDGNCRTICILYFNHLLISNHFPPSILANANRFDGFSIEELLTDTIEGMQNTFRIIDQQALQDITTQEIIHFLEENNFIKELRYAKKLFSLDPSSKKERKKSDLHTSVSLFQNDSKSDQRYHHALQILKKYIETHPWKILRGGSSIVLNAGRENAVTIIVPNVILLQWDVIHDNKKSPRDIYHKIIEIAVEEKKLSLLSQFFKGRRRDTIEYLSKFRLDMAPEEFEILFTNEFSLHKHEP